MSEIIRGSLVHTVNVKRMQGINDEQIAWVLNLAPSQVRAIPYPTPNIPRSRSVQHMQLSVMASKLMPAVEQGDRDAILTMLKVQQREANLLGLDAPKEVINRNFDTFVGSVGDLSPEQIRDMTTDELKMLVLRSRAAHATDAEPVEPPEASDPTDSPG